MSEVDDNGLVVDDLRVPPLRPISLTVARGECVGLSGPSGSGKSRLLRAIADLDCAPGEVRLDGERREAMPAPEWRRRVMFVPAESQWWADVVITHFLAPPAAADLDALGLAETDLHADPAALSSGERQRLALLRAVLREPACVLLDEPTANLDAGSVERVERWLDDRRRAGVALLWVSHDPAQIARVAQRAFRLRDRLLEPVA